jgi:hypothetical protein
MPADDNLNPCSDRIEVKHMQIVQHVNAASIQLDHLGLRQQGTRAASIYIPANRGDRSQLSKLVENRWIAHVAGVEDVFDAAKRLDGFGSQQAVRVGDDTDSHVYNPL